MKLLNLLLVIYLISYAYTTKLKLVLRNLSQSHKQENTLNQSPINLDENNETTIYITFLEGSPEIYEYCENVCQKEEEPLQYTEVTVFPYFGNIYRCQCGNQYSKWYKMDSHEELSFDVLLGDELFNDYLNLPGVNDDNCSCSSLKNLLYRLIMN